jgi:hypothetical protein
MSIEKLETVNDQEKTAQKKAWQTPQCASKHWKTPRLMVMPFDDTLGGESAKGAVENVTYVPS